jgi:hypothetical protein
MKLQYILVYKEPRFFGGENILGKDVEYSQNQISFYASSDEEALSFVENFLSRRKIVFRGKAYESKPINLMKIITVREW